MKNKQYSRIVIVKLDEKSWGCGPNVLRTSTLGLVDSVGEYCAPVWI